MPTSYSGKNIEKRLEAAIAAAGLDAKGPISPEDLGALDHFHTGGRAATEELLRLVEIDATDRVLDIGAGIGGAARLIASRYGCHVSCLEASPAFCQGAVLLNRLTALDEAIAVENAAAPPVPFPDSSFDLVWMQNVGMNIADKAGLYAEIRRVLKPGGHFAFQEVTAGANGEPHFPVPWADDPSESFLIRSEEMLALLQAAGLTVEAFDDVSAEELRRPSAAAAQSPLAVAAYVDDIGTRTRNSRRSLEEGRIRFVRCIVAKEVHSRR